MDIRKAPLNTISFSKVLRYGNTQLYLQTSYTPAFTPQPQRITVQHWLVLITVPRRVEGWNLNPDTVTHPSTNQAQPRLTSLIEVNALPLR